MWDSFSALNKLSAKSLISLKIQLCLQNRVAIRVRYAANQSVSANEKDQAIEQKHVQVSGIDQLVLWHVYIGVVEVHKRKDRTIQYHEQHNPCLEAAATPSKLLARGEFKRIRPWSTPHSLQSLWKLALSVVLCFIVGIEGLIVACILLFELVCLGAYSFLRVNGLDLLFVDFDLMCAFG